MLLLLIHLPGDSSSIVPERTARRMVLLVVDIEPEVAVRGRVLLLELQLIPQIDVVCLCNEQPLTTLLLLEELYQVWTRG